MTWVSGGDVVLILYLGVFSTLLGYVAWNIGLRAFGPTRAVTATYAIPALAVVFGAVTLIVGGVALASVRSTDTRHRFLRLQSRAMRRPQSPGY